MHNISRAEHQTGEHRRRKSPVFIYARSILIGLVLGMGLALVFAGGFFLREIVGLSSAAAQPDEPGYPLLDEVQALLDAHFVREQPDYTVRQYAAIRGMLQTLNDPYTFFIEPPVAASESQALAGTYGGIGVDIQRAAGGRLVLYPYEDSPARAAGIEDGDILRAVNGAPVDISLPQDALDQLLRGEVREGNGVEITVEKAATGDLFTTFIEFAVINVPSVTWRVLPEDSRIGYIHIRRFTSRTPEELTNALDELRNAQVAALVVDLRDNTGGLLQESIRVADEFIDDGILVIEHDAEGSRPFRGEAGGRAITLPLTVIVNGRTASGAEIVAGAIQDRGRGLLIGQRTYGKGSVQQIFPLSDGSSLHVTSSEWFTPAQQPLEQRGLTPDIEMIPDPTGVDIELSEAVRQLQVQIGSEADT